MACIREQTLEERSGIVPCHEKGCKFKYYKTECGKEIAGQSPASHCLLQLQLRAGRAALADKRNRK